MKPEQLTRFWFGRRAAKVNVAGKLIAIISTGRLNKL
jgi:hypothetical protein